MHYKQDPEQDIALHPGFVLPVFLKGKAEIRTPAVVFALIEADIYIQVIIDPREQDSYMSASIGTLLTMPQRANSSIMSSEIFSLSIMPMIFPCEWIKGKHGPTNCLFCRCKPFHQYAGTKQTVHAVRQQGCICSLRQPWLWASMRRLYEHGHSTPGLKHSLFLLV